MWCYISVLKQRYQLSQIRRLHMAGQHASIRSPQPQVMSELATGAEPVSDIPVAMIGIVLFATYLLSQLFVCTLIRFCLAGGAECVCESLGELVDFLAFLPAEKDRILVVHSNLFLDGPLFFFFLPDFQGQDSRDIPVVFLSNHVSPLKKGATVELLMCHSFGECLERAQHCYRKKHFY